MTFSLVARCAETGMFGLAISSSSPAVAARCAYARAGVGAVASQNVTDPTLGPLALDLMQGGMSAADGDRLIAAMRAGLAQGGEAGPLHSAGLLLVDQVPWPVADLRCDWTENCPIETLAATWDIYKPQMDAYVQRALDPVQAPSYGVPGDE